MDACGDHMDRPGDTGRKRILVRQWQTDLIRNGIREPFEWDMSRVALRLGVNYIGLMDEVALFDRALSGVDVTSLRRAGAPLVAISRRQYARTPSTLRQYRKMQGGLSTWGYLALTPTLAAFQAISSPPNPLNGIELRSIEVADLNTDRVRFQLHLGGIAQNDISIRALSFDNATVNGVPVFLPPTSGTFKLTRGRELRDVGSLHATLYFRDLDTLEPLRDMVRDRKADVRATIRLQPELTLLQRMALRTFAAWASMNLQRSVEVEVPGGTIGRGAALMALATADSLWVLDEVAWIGASSAMI